MIEAFVIVAVAAAAFLGTNLDNLVLLVTFYSRYGQKSQTVTAGYICGMLLITIIFVVIGEGGDFVPIDYLGLLGIVPMIMGVLGLIQLFRPQTSTVNSHSAIGESQKALFFSVLMTQLSNGTDTVITFSVLLAESTDKFDYMIIPTFLAMVLLLSALARYSLRNRILSHFLERFGRYITPFILILVGWYILADTTTDLVI